MARLGDSPESLTTTEADPESRVLGFLAIHVYVPSWAAVMLLMLRWSWPFFRARPLKAHTYSGSGQDRDTHHRVRDVLKSTLMVQPVRVVESWRMATRSGPTVGAGARETGQWREREGRRGGHPWLPVHQAGPLGMSGPSGGKRAPASPDPTRIANLLQVSLSLSGVFRFSAVKRGG